MYRPGSQGIFHHLGFEIFANIEKFKSHIFKGKPSAPQLHPTTTPSNAVHNFQVSKRNGPHKKNSP
jgi:hypothetical protein